MTSPMTAAERARRSQQARTARRSLMGYFASELTDRDVAHIRDMHGQGWSYRLLAAKFEVSKASIAGIVKFRRRVHGPGRLPHVEHEEETLLDRRDERG